MTLVGEPQNLLIAEQAGWDFGEFFLRDGAGDRAGARSRALRPAGCVERFRLVRLRHAAAGCGARRARGLLARARGALDAARQAAADRAGDRRDPAGAGAGVPRRRGGPDRAAGDHPGDGVHRRHGGAPHRQGVRGGAAVHGAAGGVLRDRGGDPRPAPVRAGDRLGAGARGPRAAGDAVPRRTGCSRRSATTCSSRPSTSPR